MELTGHRRQELYFYKFLYPFIFSTPPISPFLSLLPHNLLVVDTGLTI